MINDNEFWINAKHDTEDIRRHVVGTLSFWSEPVTYYVYESSKSVACSFLGGQCFLAWSHGNWTQWSTSFLERRRRNWSRRNCRQPLTAGTRAMPTFPCWRHWMVAAVACLRMKLAGVATSWPTLFQKWRTKWHVMYFFPDQHMLIVGWGGSTNHCRSYFYWDVQCID